MTLAASESHDNSIAQEENRPPKPWPKDYAATESASASDCGPFSFRRVRHALFYSYMSPILQHGARLHKQRKRGAKKDDADSSIRELSRRDVYAVPTFMESQRLADMFWSSQKKQQEEEAQAKPNVSQQATPEDTIRKGTFFFKRSQPKNDTLNFLMVLWALSKPVYLTAGIWQFIVVICQCSLPLLVREILLRLESSPGQPFRKEGLPLAFAIFIISLLEGIGNERQKFLSFQTGITLRSAVVSAAQEHVLRMSPAGRAGLTSGEITNLVAVDAQKIFELTQEGHYAWSCPLAMVIVSVLLLLELGVSAIVGIFTMFLMVPFVQYVVNKMMNIRKLRVMAADARIESTSAMLQGIRFTKLNRYEERFIDRVMCMRQKEVRFLRKELFFLGLTFVATVVSPVIASGFTFVFYTLIDERNILTPSMTFTSLFLFAALRFPINYAGKLMGKAAQGLQACRRFSLFFARDSLAVDCGASMPENGHMGGSCLANGAIEEEGKSLENGPLIDLKASFCTGTPGSTSSFTLSNIEMSVHRSQIMCVVGPVASGKSTLIHGLIGEILPLDEPDMRFNVNGEKVAYAAQIPFILNATVRDNILFGEPFDQERYDRVLEACCLTSDVETFHYGDLTEIGERGVTLSGGQKQRLSLARVAYSEPDVAILDDVLSALDAGTLKKVFGRLFRPPSGGGLFENTAVVLVTHASHFLNMVHSILVVVNGKSVFVGGWDELLECHPEDRNEMDAIEAIRTSVQEDHSQERDNHQFGSALKASSSTQAAPKYAKVKSNDIKEIKLNSIIGEEEDGKIMSVEERHFGLSKPSTWLHWYCQAGGWIFVITFIISMAFDRFMYVATELWLAVWTQGASQPVDFFNREYPPQSSGVHAQHQYIITYLIILLISCGATVARTHWVIQGGARCATKMFVSMLKRLLFAPMSFFDTTPIGRLMNRFTYDTETLDVTLVSNMTMLMTSLGWLLTGIILQSIILPWQLFAIVSIVIVYGFLVLHYRKSAVDLQRLDATSRSPVQAQLSEAIDGTSTIRTFGKLSYYSKIFRLALDDNSGMMMNFMASQRWLAVRIQMLGACSVFFSVAFVASFNDILKLDPGIAAILIIWSANFTISLSFFVQGLSESEASMTSVERVLAMMNLPQEEENISEDELPSLDPSWPLSGDLTFDNVALRYRPGLPISLDGLSFGLKSGQRCGVVGRTGAGKSTLAAALFRLVEIETGKIIFDGVDLSKISLDNVRGRQHAMTIIPQEPVLLPGTLQQCLDPFGDYTDEQAREALHAVRGASRGLNDINETVEEGGRNFSVGERQLICLARAMLAKPKLLFLDEATASVDRETDAHIQKMLRSRFKGTTLLTIAHRLNTIMDYDVILCIDKGRAAEFGTPADLLSQNDGIFSQLVESTGKDSAAALRSMI